MQLRLITAQVDSVTRAATSQGLRLRKLTEKLAIKAQHSVWARVAGTPECPISALWLLSLVNF